VGFLAGHVGGRPVRESKGGWAGLSLPHPLGEKLIGLGCLYR